MGFAGGCGQNARCVADAIARLKELQPDPGKLPRYNLVLGQLYLKKGEFRNAENSFIEAQRGFQLR